MARTVAPNKYSEVDCNGWSTKYKAVNPRFRELCTDPHGKTVGSSPWVFNGKSYSSTGRFMDNGHYVGHDEPSVKFESSTKGSGNTMTYYLQMPRDPVKKATNSGTVVDYGELSPAPWFGLPLCDPDSYPQNPCKPDSDSNIGSDVKNAAGSAFMELQLYPPGFGPFQTGPSCSGGDYWCAAVTIDSLESKFNFAGLNENCPEPSNFAYLQTNGVPTGPPSPQLTDFQTYTPNSHTLRIHDGDVLKLSISDPAAGFTTSITDLTTGQTGFMVASAKNGFRNTNYKNCDGTLHTFHAEYSTAEAKNQVPWAALQGGVLMEQETGHSETCASLANKDPNVFAGVTDKDIFDTCIGDSENGKNSKDTGEGPCNAKTGVCKNSTTEGVNGPVACPKPNYITSGALCEFADGICIPQGTRTVDLNGTNVKESSPVNWCQANRFQNGDLDFDGIPYQRNKWPDGTSNTPTALRYAGPFLANGKPYPTVQFETDIPGSEFLCNVTTGHDCVAPPLGAHFYPWWSLTSKQGIDKLFKKGACIWNFGGNIPGVTTNNLGDDTQYGVSATAVYGGTDISKQQKNPEVTGNCPAISNPFKK